MWVLPEESRVDCGFQFGLDVSLYVPYWPRSTMLFDMIESASAASPLRLGSRVRHQESSRMGCFSGMP